RYLCYAPVGINDWYIISVVPSSVISRQSDRLIGNLSLLVGLFVLIAIIICYKTIRFFQKNNEHLTYIAYNDAVTGYTNWEKFRIDAEKILEDNDDEHFAIVVFDINKFKVINDMFGYKTGNDILKFLSDLVSLSLGKHEIFCRNSADNFNILLRYESDAEILRRIDAIAAKLEGYIANYKIKISAGIYVITETSFDVSALCDKANISRTIAKKPNQYNNYQFFRDENRLEILHEKEIENAMDAALADGEFAMYLQPKYLSYDDSIIGAEALVRWNRSGVGLMCPGEFIPLFERNGFIRKLDMYMLDEACQLLARWQKDFPLREQITISVNISRVNLWGCTLAEDMLTIVHKYGIAPNLIEIELTESAVFENTAEMKEIMHRIKEAGFMLSIDDFGSGYSSLASLKYLPADFVKMDKSFLDEAEDDKLGKKIIRNMIHMIKSLGMKTIAEGVETQSQLDFLKTAGCDIVQGYFWAKPMPVSDFEQLMIDRECVKIL
ncbi:MAG: GGDEF domain-containing phosphodiesterase, partial [Oscillospiraceae bacterium]